MKEFFNENVLGDEKSIVEKVRVYCDGDGFAHVWTDDYEGDAMFDLSMAVRVRDALSRLIKECIEG